MNDVLQILISVAGINYQAERWIQLIAVAKASSISDEEKSEIIAVAEKAIAAETKRNAEVSALLAKYGKAENVDAKADDDEDGFY